MNGFINYCVPNYLGFIQFANFHCGKFNKRRTKILPKSQPIVSTSLATLCILSLPLTVDNIVKKSLGIQAINIFVMGPDVRGAGE